MSDESLTEKLYFVGRWELAKRYAMLFRSETWTEGLGSRPTVDQFVAWVNHHAETDYDRKTLMMMIDVYNAYSLLEKAAVRVREIGFAKAYIAIPWVSKYKDDPDKLTAFFTVCRETPEKNLRVKLREFPLK